jgi:putative transposase
VRRTSRQTRLDKYRSFNALTETINGPFNALAETINGPFKAEVIHRRRPWRSFEAVEYATLERVDWFNNRRLLEPIGNIPPAEAEANFYAAMETEPMAA